MKTFISMMRQTSARWILLFGVLAGLFFSGGEGIQLLPFPVTSVKFSKLAASDSAETSKSYTFSVFSSRNFFTQLKSKFQKDGNQYLSGRPFTFERSGALAHFRLPAALNLQKSKVFHRSPVPDSTSDRAPPSRA